MPVLLILYPITITIVMIVIANKFVALSKPGMQITVAVVTLIQDNDDDDDDDDSGNSDSGSNDSGSSDSGSSGGDSGGSDVDMDWTPDLL